MKIRTILGIGLAALIAAGCSNSIAASNGKLQVVAAENFWGSIAKQIGGSKVDVTSIISNPATDPHDYEPSANDGREVATAKFVIVNGIGYDPWAQKLVNSNPLSGRTTLDVGKLTGLSEGQNPHQWYSPSVVQQVSETIASDLAKLDPKDKAYFASQQQDFQTRALGQYNGLIEQIKSGYANTPVGISESIYEPMAQALGLKLMTPSGFYNAVAEGDDPTAKDKATTDKQATGKQIKVWIFNSQNATPDVQRITQEARSAGIPVVTVTETLSPASATFQQWQVAELQSLLSALRQATGH